MKILIAEDSKYFMAIQKTILEDHGHTVLCAFNGRQALEMAKDSRPDIITSDILMPEMDGFELCRTIKSNEELKTIPFIFYSATFTESDDKKLAMNLGASKFIIKPAKPDVFIKEIEEVIEKHGKKELSIPDHHIGESTTLGHMHNERLMKKLSTNMKKLEEDNDKLQKSEERLRNIYDNSAVGIVDTDNNYRVLKVNEAFCKMLGYSRDELLGKSLMDIIAPDDYENNLDQINKTADRKCDDFQVENRYIHKNGDLVWGLANVTSLRDSQGNIFCVTTQIQDITERKEAEEELRRSEETARAILNATTETLILIDTEGVILSINQTGADRIGKSPEELVGSKLLSHFPGELAKARQSRVDEVISAGRSVHFEDQRGKYCFSNHLFPVFDRDGKVERVAIFTIDTTAQKCAEKALKTTEERYALAIEVTNDGLWDRNIETGEIYFSPRWKKMLGYEDNELPNHREEWKKRIHPDDHAMVMGEMDNYFDGDAPYYLSEYRLRHKDGSYRWVMAKGAIVRDEEGNPTRFVGSHTDITESKQAEETLRNVVEGTSKATGQDFFNTLVSHLAKALKVRYAMVGELTGIHNECIQTIAVWAGADYAENFDYKLAGTPCNRVVGKKNCVYTKDIQRLFPEDKMLAEMGAESYIGVPLFDGKGQALGILAVLDDKALENASMAENIATIFAGRAGAELGRIWYEKEKESLEAQLRQAQKMETIGTLTGGIAHDFNNILTPILTYAEIIQEDMPSDNPSRSDIEGIIKAAERAKELVRHMLTFSRHNEQERRPVEIKLIVNEVIKLLRPILPTTIEIRKSISTDCGTVLADPGQMHQVLMNICTNAAHAMQDEGGVLKVSVEAVKLDRELAAGHLNLQPGKYVRLSIKDTGHGMDNETMERIFDPFFTTKGVGEGTGLGLSVVHGIVLNHEGEINVESTPGEGSTFHIFLPMFAGDLKWSVDISDRTIPKGKEHILFVDDEMEIVSMGGKMLRRLGYKVTESCGGIEALKKFSTNPEKYDLIITDYTMPRMTGLHLTREVRSIRPDISIIIISGYNEKITPENIQNFGISEYVVKPFAIFDLGTSIRRVLDGGK